MDRYIVFNSLTIHITFMPFTICTLYFGLSKKFKRRVGHCHDNSPSSVFLASVYREGNRGWRVDTGFMAKSAAQKPMLARGVLYLRVRCVLYKATVYKTIKAELPPA